MLLFLPRRVPSVDFYPPMENFGGTPLLEWCLRRLMKCSQYAKEALVVAVDGQIHPEPEIEEIVRKVGAMPFMPSRLGKLNCIQQALQDAQSNNIAVINLEAALGPLDLIHRVFQFHIENENDYTNTINVPDRVAPVVYRSSLIERMVSLLRPGLPTDPQIIIRSLTAASNLSSQTSGETIRSSPCDFKKLYRCNTALLPRRVSLQTHSALGVARKVIKANMLEVSPLSSPCAIMYRWQQIDKLKSAPRNARLSGNALPLNISIGWPKSKTKQPVRVLLVSSASVFGGPHSALTAIMRNIQPYRISMSALVGFSGHFTRLLRSYGIECSCPETNFSDTSMESFQFVLSALRDASPDVIHLDGVECKAVFFAASALNIPIIQHIRLARIKAYKDTLQHATRLVSVSRFVTRELEREGIDESRICTIYDGVSIKEDNAPIKRCREVREALGIPCNKKLIMQVGRIEPNKGQGMALQAFRLLRRKQPNAHLVFVGEVQGAFDYYNTLQDMVQNLNQTEFVSFLPFQEDMDSLYASASVLVNCGMHEALGMTVLEAMAAQLPVVVTDSGGLPEMIEHGVSGLVASNTSESIAECIGAILQDDNFALALGRNARLRVQSEFSASKAAAQMMVLYENVALETTNSC